MRKANATHKALLAFTVFFVLIAIYSFTAFQTEKLCTDASKKCLEAAPKNGGKLLWDDFSRRLISHTPLQ